MTCGGELVSAGALLEERTTKHYDTQREDYKYNKIYYVHNRMKTTDYTDYTDYQ